MPFPLSRIWLALVLTLCLFVPALSGSRPAHAQESEGDASFAELMNRPLRVPPVVAGDACPRSDTNRIADGRIDAALGSGPLYLTLGQDGMIQVHSFDLHNGLYAARVVLAVAPDIRSPILVRGQQINGPNSVRFAYDGTPTLDALRLGAALDLPVADAEDDWRFAASSLGVAGPGCYVLQADGPYFSETIVFEVSTG